MDGKILSGAAITRFLVYQQEAELAQKAANHGFLKTLAAKGGGIFIRLKNWSRSCRNSRKTGRQPIRARHCGRTGSLSPRSHHAADQVHAVLKSACCLASFFSWFCSAWNGLCGGMGNGLNSGLDPPRGPHYNALSLAAAGRHK